MEECIYNRHSTRNFDPSYMISRTEQEAIIKAGLRAPSPKNRQPWKFVVLEQKDDLRRVSSALREQVLFLKKNRALARKDDTDLDMAITTAAIIEDVSMLIFICYVRDEDNEHGEVINWPITAQAFEVLDLQAIGACVENMLLMANSIGISSLWIGDVLYAEDVLSNLFSIKWPMVSAVAFGKAAPQYSPRCRLEDKANWFHEGITMR